MVSLDDRKEMEETLHLMSSPANASRPAAAIAQLEAGDASELEPLEP